MEPLATTQTGSGFEVARTARRRLQVAALIANGVGGLAVFLLGFLGPVVPDPEDALPMGLVNLVTFVVVMAIGFPYGIRRGERLGAPLREWLLAERPATAEEQRLALTFPARLTLVSVRIWAAAAVVFAAVNVIYSIELGVVSGLAVVFGGATCCAVLYLLSERALRPGLALALAGRAPPPTRGPSVAARLTITWTLVTGVPILAIASILVADLAGASIDVPTRVLMLILALVALGVGLSGMLLAARSVGDPVRAVQEAMSSVEQGDFGARVPVDDGSEIGRLQAGFNRMAAGLQERERVRDLFGRHVGRDVAQAALEGDLTLGGEEREVAVLFVDLVGSTELAARRPPTEVVSLLNAFFRLVVETAERCGGWVNKFEGDAALCVFGAPTARDDPAGCALHAGRELHDRLVAELPELDAGIGVSAGVAVAGNIGAEHRFEYTVIGDPVNEAARLCELAKKRPERMLASDSALERSDAEERRLWSLREEVELRGRQAPTRLAVRTGGG